MTPPPPSAADPSYRWGTPGLQGVTVAPVPAANRMQVSNTLERDTGDLRVAKEITGDTDGYIGGDDPAFTGFPVSAICYLNAPDDDVVMQAIVDVKPGEELPAAHRRPRRLDLRRRRDGRLGSALRRFVPLG